MTNAQPQTGLIPEWTVADRLRKARELTGLDQNQFANAIEVSRTTVGNYEQGHVKPRRIVLRAWALRTGVSLDWLIGEECPRLESNQRPRDYKVAGSNVVDIAVWLPNSIIRDGRLEVSPGLRPVAMIGGGAA